MEAIHDGATQRLDPSLVFDIESAIVQHPQAAQLDDAQFVRVRRRAARLLGRRTLPSLSNAQFAVVVGVVLTALSCLAWYQFGLGSVPAALFAALGLPVHGIGMYYMYRGAK